MSHAHTDGPTAGVASPARLVVVARSGNRIKLPELAIWMGNALYNRALYEISHRGQSRFWPVQVG